MFMVGGIDMTANLAYAVIIVIMDTSGGDGDSFCCCVWLIVQNCRCSVVNLPFGDAVGGGGLAVHCCRYSFHMGASTAGAFEGCCGRRSSDYPCPGGGFIVFVTECGNFLPTFIPTTIFA